jgi:glycosyltransferase involved in cell wall biosynthesis
MAVPRVSAFIAVSRLIQSKWLMSYGRQPFFIPNGVDSFRFNPNVNGSQMRRKLGVQDKFVVLSIGRLSYQKGLEYLIQAISQIQKENENMVVLICGRGEKESYLKKLTRDLGLEGIVKFLGFIPSEQLPELYAACDVFVIPSIFETFPLALLEALSVGKPVIASNVGGAREIAHELKTICGATIVQPKNPSHIAKAISWYFDHKDVGNSARHVLARREYIIRNFSWEKIAEQTLDLYNAIE